MTAKDSVADTAAPKDAKPAAAAKTKTTVKADAPAKPATAAKPATTAKPAAAAKTEAPAKAATPPKTTTTEKADAPAKAEVKPQSAPAKSETPKAATASAPVATPPEKSRSIFLPLVLGGVIAAGIGYVASEYNWFTAGEADAIAALRGDLEAQQTRVAALEAMEPAEVDLSPLQTQLGDLDTRLAALEDRPAIVAPDGVDADAVAASAAAAYAAELEDMRGELQTLLENARNAEAATASAATTASAQAAIAKIVSALDAGQPFAEPLADLKALDLGEIDPALDAVAADGAATLSFLQAEFPAQARAALAAARSGAAGDGQQGLGSFLKRSLGARSVTPQEGDDPDAVLSRAEAAIKTGDLNATLTELDTLPEDAQAAIAEWRGAADARVAARDAADALAQRLTAD
ncbi:hypothetical protein ABMC88_07940 [Sulfitobacter sp. HNIBRBA2951]|uniref:COG4223 family protein n=1 Tax=Sulfitobacter aquimarinus TaxID=3158557 RepID=UPI0032E04D4D